LIDKQYSAVSQIPGEISRDVIFRERLIRAHERNRQTDEDYAAMHRAVKTSLQQAHVKELMQTCVHAENE